MNLKKELIFYLIFGVLTTLVNIMVYLFFVKLFSVNYIISNILAWFFSVLFAYITNRLWVFESQNDNIIKECFLFFGGRLFSGVVDTGMMILFIDILCFGDFISKVIIQVFVVVLNYVISKLLIFK
ncbi:GtrA family protein [uncultured Methanobrevibacter sp.]|uniref:GtrA family protein n=1 Tax=uncultured Methanobrevibacter sp. TaxID=253161 RepID=UPI0026393D96